MTGKDARFEDANDEPLRLRAMDGDDLAVISALLQDGIFSTSDLSWDPNRREFAILINRFRWELPAEDRFERVRSVFLVSDITRLRSGDLGSSRAPPACSLLSAEFEAGEDSTGTLRLMLSGEFEITFDVECLDVRLIDVTRPYGAVSGSKPDHG